MKKPPLDWSRVLAISGIHAGCLLAPFYLSPEAVLLTFVLWYICGCLGITLGYHRLLTHRSFETYRWLRYTLAILGTLNWQGGPIRWVGTHRVHHQYSDEFGDPHTPKHGFFWAHILWTLTKDPRASEYRAAANERDLGRDTRMYYIDKYFWAFQIPLVVLLYFVGGIPAIVWGVFVRMTVGYHVTWLVNSATHMWGYRNFPTRDQSRNNWWVALLSFGEGWHNNHHGQPNSAAHGMRWFEIDLTYQTIKLLELLGLAWKVREPNLAELDAHLHPQNL